MLPWLLLRMLELILLGGPLVVLTDLLVLHLSLQGHLLPGLLLTNIPALLTLLLMAVWCLVLGAYVSLGQASLASKAAGREAALKVDIARREALIGRDPGSLRHKDKLPPCTERSY